MGKAKDAKEELQAQREPKTVDKTIELTPEQQEAVEKQKDLALFKAKVEEDKKEREEAFQKALQQLSQQYDCQIVIEPKGLVINVDEQVIKPQIVIKAN
jgi:hypothetical protein